MVFFRSGRIAAICFGGSVAITSVIAAFAKEEPVALSTPPGVMLVDVVQETADEQAQYLWTRLADEQGNALYFRAGDATSCDASCKAHFPPFHASSDARPYGDWSLVDAGDGSKQWAYKGKALYRYPEADKRFMEVVNLRADIPTDIGQKAADDTSVLSMSFSPVPGWQIAAFNPAASMRLPEGIAIAQVVGADGFALTNSDGLTLYQRSVVRASCARSKSCDDRWHAVAAPLLAASIGEFSVVRGTDGSPQWAFKDQPLYRFEGDYIAGDTNGIGMDAKTNVARISQDFLPESVEIHDSTGRGYILTAKGKTLYGRHEFAFAWGGTNSHGGFRTPYRLGKDLGTKGCDAACLKEWHPFHPMPDARSQGYWEIATRSDGSKQWLYKGSAAYTYTGDKKPGDVDGNDLYDLVVGRTARYSLEEVGGGRGTGAGVYWHVLYPY